MQMYCCHRDVVTCLGSLSARVQARVTHAVCLGGARRGHTQVIQQTALGTSGLVLYEGSSFLPGAIFTSLGVLRSSLAP